MRYIIFIILCNIFLLANVGKITSLVGTITIIRDQQNIKASINMPIEQKDIIKTAKRSRAIILFKDNTSITIGQKSILKVEDYFFDINQPKKSKSIFRFKKGLFKTISGKIGKINRKNFKILTKSASIGIRGSIGTTIVYNDTQIKHITHSGIFIMKDLKTNQVVEIPKGFTASLDTKGLKIHKTTPKDLNEAKIVKKEKKKELKAKKETNIDKKSQNKGKKKQDKQEEKKEQKEKKENKTQKQETKKDKKTNTKNNKKSPIMKKDKTNTDNKPKKTIEKPQPKKIKPKIKKDNILQKQPKNIKSIKKNTTKPIISQQSNKNIQNNIQEEKPLPNNSTPQSSTTLEPTTQDDEPSNVNVNDTDTGIDETLEQTNEETNNVVEEQSSKTQDDNYQEVIEENIKLQIQDIYSILDLDSVINSTLDKDAKGSDDYAEYGYLLDNDDLADVYIIGEVTPTTTIQDYINNSQTGTYSGDIAAIVNGSTRSGGSNFSYYIHIS
jgi:hypothetical protein